MSLISSAAFHYRRWAALRAAEQCLPVPSAEEKRKIADLQSQFHALPVAKTEGLLGTEADWNGAMNRLRQLGGSADPRAFQRWDVIIGRMAHINSPATPVELALLQNDAEWESRWEPALREVEAGRPIRYAGYPESSEVLIQTLHNVYRLEKLSGVRVSDWRTIVEFGGGFGGMCRVLHVLGFAGRYMIYDLEPFSILQRYYLGQCDLNAVVCTSDFGALERFVKATPSGIPSSFWATWSLSETPLSLRERIKPLAEQLGTACIAFQGAYGEVDNREYFTRNWLMREHVLERIAHRPDDYYLSC